MFSTLFGDVFLESAGGYRFLDSVQGTLVPQWHSRELLEAELGTPEGQDQYLFGGLAMAAERPGKVLGSDQVYDFTVPPILGDQFTVDNISTADFVVALNIAGHLLRQVTELPPGTKISGFTVDGQ